MTLCRYTESEAAFGVLKGSSGLGPSLEGKLMMDRELLYSQLVDIKDKMVRIQHCSQPPTPTHHLLSL